MSLQNFREFLHSGYQLGSLRLNALHLAHDKTMETFAINVNDLANKCEFIFWILLVLAVLVLGISIAKALKEEIKLRNLLITLFLTSWIVLLLLFFFQTSYENLLRNVYYFAYEHLYHYDFSSNNQIVTATQNTTITPFTTKNLFGVWSETKLSITQLFSAFTISFACLSLISTAIYKLNIRIKNYREQKNRAHA
jgi:TRAP-type C4-dicarboxylate transport system permease large subunit